MTNNEIRNRIEEINSKISKHQQALEKLVTELTQIQRECDCSDYTVVDEDMAVCNVCGEEVWF